MDLACPHMFSRSNLIAAAFGSSSQSKVEMISSLTPRDLWMRLQIMWLQFEVDRSPVGFAWGRFGAGLGPQGPQTGPESTPSKPDRTSDNIKLLAHELQPHP